MLTKDELRAMLDDKVTSHLESEPNAIKLYAAEPLPARRPWRKRPTGHDRVYAEVMDELKNKESSSSSSSVQSVS